jgi:ribosomal-protein-serine acetyltransferase
MTEIQIDQTLRLSSVTQEDAQELFDLVDTNRTRLREWLPWLDKTKELKDTISFIQHAQETAKADGTMTMTIRLQGKLVGLVSFHKIDRETASTSLGYWIAQDAEGRSHKFWLHSAQPDRDQH